MVSAPNHAGNPARKIDRKSREPGKEKAMVVMDYRTQDRLADCGFSIEFQSDVGWRAYIIFQLFRQGDDDSQSLPYQSLDRNGRCYVNWPARIDSLGEAKMVAVLWAELIQRYQCAEKQRRDGDETPKKRFWSIEQMEEDAA
jgi:hypothetical protein